VAIAEVELMVIAGVLTPVAAYAGDIGSNDGDTGSSTATNVAADVAINMDILFIPVYLLNA
jgi:hypothetical protein